MAIEQKIGSAKGCWLAFEALQCKEKEIYRCSSMTKVTSNSSKKNRTTLFFWHYTLKQKSGGYNSKTQRNRETKTLTIFLRTQKSEFLQLYKFWNYFNEKQNFGKVRGFVSNPQIKPEILLFIEIIPELLKLKEFWLLRKGFKVLVSLFLRVLELQITQKSTKKSIKNPTKYWNFLRLILKKVCTYYLNHIKDESKYTRAYVMREKKMKVFQLLWKS